MGLANRLLCIRTGLRFTGDSQPEEVTERNGKGRGKAFDLWRSADQINYAQASSQLARFVKTSMKTLASR